MHSSSTVAGSAARLLDFRYLARLVNILSSDWLLPVLCLEQTAVDMAVVTVAVATAVAWLVKFPWTPRVLVCHIRQKHSDPFPSEGKLGQVEESLFTITLKSICTVRDGKINHGCKSPTDLRCRCRYHSTKLCHWFISLSLTSLCCFLSPHLCPPSPLLPPHLYLYSYTGAGVSSCISFERGYVDYWFDLTKPVANSPHSVRDMGTSMLGSKPLHTAAWWQKNKRDGEETQLVWLALIDRFFFFFFGLSRFCSHKSPFYRCRYLPHVIKQRLHSQCVRASRWSWAAHGNPGLHVSISVYRHQLGWSEFASN